MYSRHEIITPDRAADYLTHNVKNRKLRQSVVRQYARDMKNDKWQVSPQGISFYQNGNLADGQTRLNAIIMADKPVEIYVTYDVPNDTTIQDRGAKRTSSDILYMAGKNSAAAGTAGVGTLNFLFLLAGMKTITDQMREAFIEEYEEILCDAVNYSTHGTNKFVVCGKASIMAAAFCALYCGVELNTLDEFFTKANTGFIDSPSQSAAIVLRNTIIQDYTGKDFPNRKFAFVVATNAIKDYANEVPRTKKYRADVEPPYWKRVKKAVFEKYTQYYELK